MRLTKKQQDELDRKMAEAKLDDYQAPEGVPEKAVKDLRKLRGRRVKVLAREKR